jgi:hypothetical protein
MQEIWKSIVGFEGLYEVSNFGQVRSLDRTLAHGRFKGKPLKLRDNSLGYYCVVLCDGKEHNKRVHQLVAEAFIGPRPEGLVVNHKDSNPKNNCVDNLEYITPQQNAIHAYKAGRIKTWQGKDHPECKITEKDVIEIRSLRGKLRQADIGKLYGITGARVGQIQRRVAWAHVD